MLMMVKSPSHPMRIRTMPAQLELKATLGAPKREFGTFGASGK